MKTIRRPLLVFCLTRCCTLVGLGPLAAAAQDATASAVPPIAALSDQGKGEASPAPATEELPKLRCEYLITVADDFVVEAYHNGKPVPEADRELLLERFGATAEKIHVAVREGDWLVFHVVQNRLRWGGSKYFAVAGCLAENEFGFVSDPSSTAWSVCDNPAKARDFILHRNAGHNARAQAIETPWGEGDDHMKEFAGKDFAGQALWGRSPSTWIKFVAGQPPAPAPDGEHAERIEPTAHEPDATAPAPAPAPPEPKSFSPRHWPVQILSAIYGTGGKDADVTAKVKEHVETFQRRFDVNPQDLGADPNPYWNKSLHIVYVKDGIRREQWRNENEYVLPESFYCPQDAAELRSWLPESRWFGEQPEIQFHADQTFTSPGVPGTHRWEATGANTLRLTWSEDHIVNYGFDYTWSSFSEAENGRNVFHLQK